MPAREIGIDDILPLHSIPQRDWIKHIPFDNRDPVRIVIGKPTRPAQIERQVYIGPLKEKLGCIACKLPVRTENQNSIHLEITFQSALFED